MARKEGTPEGSSLNFDKIDPDTLDEAARQIYEAALEKSKSLEGDYTQKTQSLAEERKALEASKEWVEAFKAYRDRGVSPQEIAQYVSNAENFFSNFDRDAYQRALGAQSGKEQSQTMSSSQDELYIDDATQKWVQNYLQTEGTKLAKALNDHWEKKYQELEQNSNQKLNLYEDLGKVRQSYSSLEDYSDTDVIQKAQELGTTSLEAAADQLYKEKVLENTWQKRLEEEKAKWAEEQKAQHVKSEFDFNAGPSKFSGYGKESKTDDVKSTILQEAVKEMGPGILDNIGSSENIIQGAGRE